MKETFGNYIDVIHAYRLLSFRNSITNFNTYQASELLKRINMNLIILKNRFPTYVSDDFITLIKYNCPNMKCDDFCNNMIYTTDTELPYIQPTFRSGFDIIEGLDLLKLLTKLIYNKSDMSLFNQDNCIETVSKSLIDVSYNTNKLQITPYIENKINESLTHDIDNPGDDKNIDTSDGIVNINMNDTVNLTSPGESNLFEENSDDDGEPNLFEEISNSDDDGSVYTLLAEALKDSEKTYTTRYGRKTHKTT